MFFLEYFYGEAIFQSINPVSGQCQVCNRVLPGQSLYLYQWKNRIKCGHYCCLIYGDFEKLFKVEEFEKYF